MKRSVGLRWVHVAWAPPLLPALSFYAPCSTVPAHRACKTPSSIAAIEHKWIWCMRLLKLETQIKFKCRCVCCKRVRHSPLSCATAHLVEANWAGTGKDGVESVVLSKLQMVRKRGRLIPEHVGYSHLVVQVEVAEHSGIHCKRQTRQVNRSHVKCHTK